MKIIALGDFHGRFTKKIMNEIKKENPDLILCTGDLPDTEKTRKIIFKHWEELKEKSLEEIIGKKKIRELIRKEEESTEEILKRINNLGIPVIMIWGNSDEVSRKKNNEREPLNKKVKKYKNIKFISNERIINKKEIQIIGFSGYRFPTEKGIIKNERINKKQIREINKKWNDRLKRIFKRINKERKTIFLTHDPPRGYFDKVLIKESPLRNKHIGDEYFRRIIEKKKPDYHISGHMHEYQGKKKLGRTTIIATGAMINDEYVIINTDNNKIIFRNKKKKRKKTRKK